jgi:hypothetical protein
MGHTRHLDTADSLCLPLADEDRQRKHKSEKHKKKKSKHKKVSSVRLSVDVDPNPQAVRQLPSVCEPSISLQCINLLFLLLFLVHILFVSVRRCHKPDDAHFP